MKKFIVYLVVIILTVSLGFAIFYLVRDNEIISISNASIYRDVGDKFTLDVKTVNKKSYTDIKVDSSNHDIVTGSYNSKLEQYNAEAVSGGVARINVRTSNQKFRNLWCDVIVGDGSIESPFYISTAAQLAAIGRGEEIKDENGIGTGVFYGGEGYEKYHSNLCYKLIANIDASTINQGYWVPIKNFQGRLDGNGLTVKNIYIDASEYQEKLGDKADKTFIYGSKAGLFETIGIDAIVYNLKLERYQAIGQYSDFGAIAAINYGTVERIEVKDLYSSVNATIYGGIVGTNMHYVETIETEVDGNPVAVYERHIGRVDRCSVSNHVIGKTDNVDGSTNVITMNGTVGGIVGLNYAGTLVYSYTRGEIYVGANSNIVYGGVVAKNIAVNGLKYNTTDEEENEFQGAHIKDCYADIRLTLAENISASTSIGGAIGINEDYTDGEIEVGSGKNRVNNYLLGIYYNKDSLNYEQEGITKQFEGIARFTLDEGVEEVDFQEKETIVYGLSADGMKVKDNFVSHITQEVEFNEDGLSKGVVEKEVLWLFETIWMIDTVSADGLINDGMPYLNYQVVYVPDDFRTVGTPVVPNTMDDFYYEIEIEYPITIVSDEGKIRLKVKEYRQLIYSPTGIEITWSSQDESIVRVDDNGRLEGVKAGVTTVTATTKSGNQASVTVIVENIPYAINMPSTIYLYQGQSYSLDNIVIDPDPTGNDIVVYDIKGTDGIATTLATISGSHIVASVSEVGTAKLTVKVADTEAYADIVVTEAPAVTLTANPNNITGYIQDSNFDKNGTITITNNIPDAQENQNARYDYTFVNGAGIVELSWANNNQLNYTIKGVGTATVRVFISEGTFAGKGEVLINFNIKDEEIVALTLSSTTITGYFSTMSKTGSVTVSNSANKALAYTATSSDESVVTVSMSGNAMNYTIHSVGNATVEIRVSTSNYKGSGYVYFQILNYNVPQESITLNYSSTTINRGAGITLTASGNYSSAITWTSTNTSVATVDQNGYVYGVNAGSTTIIAKTAYAEARCIVYVVDPNNQYVTVGISPTALTMYVGDDKVLSTYGNNSGVAFTSGNTSVVSVDANGKVHANALGTAIILASAKDSAGKVRAYAYCTITVVERPITLSIVASADTAYEGDTVTFTASVSNGATVTKWTYPASLATWTENGNTLTATGCSVGTLSVSAEYNGGVVTKNVNIVANATYSQYIYNLSQLKAVRYHKDKTFYLAADINVGDWNPIGTTDDPFTGSFTSLKNGNTYYKLIGVNVNNKSYASVFGYVKNADINNLIVENSTFTGVNTAGAISGQSYNSSFYRCQVINSTITAKNYVGGIVGYAQTTSSTSTCLASGSTITATSSTGYVGGIIGYAISTSMYYDTVSSCSIRIASGATGYAGGIVGYMNYASVTYGLVNASTSIQAGSTISDYAGGIAGYTNGNGAYTAIANSTIASASVSGYYAGGIGGAVNSSQITEIKFKEYKSGYRGKDIEKLNATSTVNSVAVRTAVTVTGNRAGGLFGVISSGVVTNSYTRATIAGLSGSAVKAGFAAEIRANGVNNNGGSGQIGLVRYCYAAVTFSGSGSAYAITMSLVHNYATFGDGSNRDGYVMDYLFDDGTDGGANYNNGSNIFSSDKIGAKKSSAEMRQASSYNTDNNNSDDFSSAYWNIGSAYATLKTER